MYSSLRCEGWGGIDGADGIGLVFWDIPRACAGKKIVSGGFCTEMYVQLYVLRVIVTNWTN